MMKRASILAVLCVVCALTAASAAMPRAEYPRPQFERDEWVNLNGEWTFELDPSMSGWDRKLFESGGFDGRIVVPFAPESELSGVGHKDFIRCIWYQREIEVPEAWRGKRVLLNFGAVYYESEVYIDGRFAGRHFGGSDSFAMDITPLVEAGGRHSLVVCASSDVRSGVQGAGKQSLREYSYGCMYTRTTGIWQTVWLEAADECALAGVHTQTDIDQSQVAFTLSMRRVKSGCTVDISVWDDGRRVARSSVPAAQGIVAVVPLKNARLWSPEDPHLYDVVFEVRDAGGVCIDRVKSYFGMRKIHVEGNRIYLNNEPYYMRLVLDQGFYPDGVWTAPSDEALRRDIELSKAAGFNGARLHQKVFEERFHYWADRLGYLTWGEYPSWGMNTSDELAARNFIAEWCGIVERDRNHPSIVVWTPVNEEWWPDARNYPRLMSDIYDLTRRIDPSRPVNGASGGTHIVSDIWTVHNYEQNAERLAKIFYDEGRFFKAPCTVQDDSRGSTGFNNTASRYRYDFPEYDGSVPYFVDEFGGIRCLEVNPPQGDAWGYGDAARTRDEFYERLRSQVRALLDLSDHIWGFCYTQLTDVEQEQNGIYYYDRTQKYDSGRLREIFSMPIENPSADR